LEVVVTRELLAANAVVISSWHGGDRYPMSGGSRRYAIFQFYLRKYLILKIIINFIFI